MYPYDLQFIKAETAYRTDRAAHLMGPPIGGGLRRLRGVVRDLLGRHSSGGSADVADRVVDVGVDVEVPQHVS